MFFFNLLGLDFPLTFHSVGLNWFHNFLNSWLFGVLIFVIMIFLFLFVEINYFKLSGSNYSAAESFCALLPTLIIFIQMVPSMYFLYLMSSLDVSNDISLKVIGHQWYWHYEFMDIFNLEFDSFMKATDDFNLGDFRILDVDNRVILPTFMNVRLCFSGADVIHSWTLPMAGVKVDCSPGLLNCVSVNFPLVGLYFGQCSEICGSNHSFMPIAVEIVPWTLFFNWL